MNKLYNLIFNKCNFVTNKNKYKYKVYLCIDHFKDNNFKCIKFNSIDNANNFYHKKKDYVSNYTIILINKYIPNIFDIYILNFKLKNFFIKLKIDNNY